MQVFSLDYLLRPAKIVPQEGKSPVIVMIHGYGSNKEDLFSFAEELPEQYVIVSVQAPYPLSDFGYAWYAIDLYSERWCDIVQAKTSQGQILTFIDQICNSYDLDRDNVTLLGFSQGCILSLSIALSFPDKVHRVVGLSGYIESSMLDSNFSKNDFSQLKIYLSHGASDQVIPIEWARESVPFLQNLNIDFTYEEFPVGHSVSPQNFYSFREWIKKNP